MTQPQPTVFVIDDDAIVREALDSLLRSVGLTPGLFGSANDLAKIAPRWAFWRPNHRPEPEDGSLPYSELISVPW
jgi:CheY-like chemotaxis protein